MARLRAALRRQRGAALVAMLTLLVLVSSAVLIEHLSAEATTRRSAADDDATASALAEAKAALIAWSVSHLRRPGVLPFPDRGADGQYDGQEDCASPPVGPGLLLGRLPWAGGVFPPCRDVPLSIDLKDADGEPLWYAVSRNLVPGGGSGRLNTDIGDPGQHEHPWITVLDQNGVALTDPATGGPLQVAAVIIAPGSPLPAQDRSGAVPNPDQYLDSVTLGYTVDNADFDECSDEGSCMTPGEEFVMFNNPPAGLDFNDRLIYITVDELMRAVEKRALGEAAQALTRYRNGSGADCSAAAGSQPCYPWLAPFRNPRHLSTGTVFLGDSYWLQDTAADFVADGVRPGDIVVNETDGGSLGPVSTVASASLTLAGMTGGTENDLDPGESYRVEPSFKSDPSGAPGPPGGDLRREGQLPVHLPNEVFYTRFGGRWEVTPGTAVLSTDTSPLAPTDQDLEQGNINVLDGNGRCMWTRPEEATCVGSETKTVVRMIAGVPTNVTRTVEYSLAVVGNTLMTPTAPHGGDVRRRNVSLHNPDPCMSGSPPAAPCPLHSGLPVPSPVAAPSPLLPPPGYTWSIRMTDTDGVSSGSRTVSFDSNTKGYLSITGIHYDLGAVFDNAITPADEIPDWFVEDGWHRLVYARVAEGFKPGGTGSCIPGDPFPTGCLTLDVGGAIGVRDDIEAVLAGPGGPFVAFQDREFGTACPPGSDLLCDYFEGVNDDTGTDTASRDELGATFNDQIRVVQPVPPP